MLKQFIEKKEKEFEDKFYNSNGWNPSSFGIELEDDIKSFHTTSLTEFATLLRSEIEGRRMGDKDYEKINNFFVNGYNMALDDILALLEK